MLSNTRHQSGFMCLLKIAAAALEIFFASFLLGLYLFSTFYLLEYIRHLKLCFYLDSAVFYSCTFKNVSLFFSYVQNLCIFPQNLSLKHNPVFCLYLIYSSFLLHHHYILALLIFSLLLFLSTWLKNLLLCALIFFTRSISA